MFFKKVIEPFIETFYGITEYLFAKVILVIALFAFEMTVELFDTPQRYWETLAYLVFIDLAAKNLYILFNDRGQFSLTLMIKKTIYKGSSYILVCTAATLMSNQWEAGSNYLQYIVYSGLCVLECISIGKHSKLIAYFITFFNQLRTGKINLRELKKQADEYTKKTEQSDD